MLRTCHSRTQIVLPSFKKLRYLSSTLDRQTCQLSLSQDGRAVPALRDECEPRTRISVFRIMKSGYLTISERRCQHNRRLVTQSSVVRILAVLLLSTATVQGFVAVSPSPSCSSSSRLSSQPCLPAENEARPGLGAVQSRLR